MQRYSILDSGIWRHLMVVTLQLGTFISLIGPINRIGFEGDNNIMLHVLCFFGLSQGWRR